MMKATEQVFGYAEVWEQRKGGVSVWIKASLLTVGRLGDMPDRSRRPRDPNQLGKLIVDIATGEVEDTAGG